MIEDAREYSAARVFEHMRRRRRLAFKGALVALHDERTRVVCVGFAKGQFIEPTEGSFHLISGKDLGTRYASATEKHDRLVGQLDLGAIGRRASNDERCHGALLID